MKHPSHPTYGGRHDANASPHRDPLAPGQSRRVLPPDKCRQDQAVQGGPVRAAQMRRTIKARRGTPHNHYLAFDEAHG
ncbi:hypothetical protein EJ06DRAFT_527650 [Trichodelitschia bisporula]|uniref:Uncharacterized protein n=1 Tax=Trichodelitschia bisporula TaxID=703511 RepID=A0A6G1I2Y9_9PEZI|nr:hypothetical protein EJ06DRAFT_527650 [Trichodelitschia bisporula]